MIPRRTKKAQGSAEAPKIILHVSNDTITKLSDLPVALDIAAEQVDMILSSVSPPSVVRLVFMSSVGIVAGLGRVQLEAGARARGDGNRGCVEHGDTFYEVAKLFIHLA